MKGYKTSYSSVEALGSNSQQKTPVSPQMADYISQSRYHYQLGIRLEHLFIHRSLCFCSVTCLTVHISQNEIPTSELVEKSYKTFRHPDVTPLKKLNDRTFILELFHGPTLSFKDVALQLLGNLFEFFLLRRNARKGPGEKPENLTVVGATSGDTGRYVDWPLAGFYASS